MNICHISTLHPRFDVRIFHKECVSLTAKYDVNLIVADGLGDDVVNNVRFHDIGLGQSSRIKRAFIDSKKALNKAIELDSDVYHIHDPELLKIGLKLLKRGKKVVYDVHEDLPRQVYGKPYIKESLKPLVSKMVEWQENRSAKKYSYICAATPFIRDRFLKVNTNTIDINNYPILSDNKVLPNYDSRENNICYIGGITEVRGVYELIQSLSISKTKLLLAGDFKDENFKEKCMQLDAWQYVDFLDYLPREEIIKLLSKTKIGIVTLHPLVNYLDSLPVKMFEYMYAGIPVIASNFKFWEDILDKTKAGITVNPLSPEDIAAATLTLLSETEKAKEMGRKGYKAVVSDYNWHNEEIKLLGVYEKILNS